ncbi:MAG TPA: dynamin family protein [Pseudonocardiaceae bacterium]
MTSAPQAGTPLPQVVRQTRERLTALLTTADPEAAAWVEQVRTARPETPTVVVVGETNRGKSSLVNALLATPGLSPVDADVATATYLVLRHGEQWAAGAHYPAVSDPVPFDPAELPRWVSAAHDLPDGALPPRYVEVRGPVPLLERLTLVDTPGVGGLDTAHGELAAEAAGAATALLFVVDAGAPFTRGELGFLQRLSDRVETVVFALTKTDLHRGWRQVLEADRTLLAEHAPRFAGAEFHPVSARLFETAAAAPTAEVATLLRERSGVAELQTALQRQVSGRAVMLGEANTLRALSTALAGVIARLEADERALAGAERGEASADALRQRRDELAAERRSSGRSWQLRLRGEIQRARVESLHDVANQVRAVQTWFRRAVDEADRATLAGLPYQLDAALGMISARVTAGLGQRLARVTDSALAELFTPAELDAVRAEFARRGGDRPPIVLRPPERRVSGVEDKMLVAMGVSGGIGVGRIAALPLAGLGAAAGLVVLPVTIVLGLGAGWWMARARRHSADKAHLKQWLVDVLADARSALDQVVAEQMIDAEQQLSLALDEALGRRVAAIEDELREVDRALRLDAADRSRELQSVRRGLADATAGRERVEQLLARIRELRDR